MHVQSIDTEIFYLSMGDGPDVVLLHPFPSSHEVWLAVTEMLANKYRVTLLDIRGLGRSGHGTGPATMQKHAEDLERVCKEAQIRRAVFGGISVGGYILFEFWRRYRDRVRALMLANTRASADTPQARLSRIQSAKEVVERGADPFIESMLPKLLGESTRRNRPDLVAEARMIMSRNRPLGIAAVLQGMAERPDSTPTLKTIHVPTLIVGGEEDTSTSVADVQALAQGIAESQLRIIPLAGHYALFERPTEAELVLRQFLDQLA